MADTLSIDSKQISDVLRRSISEYKSEVNVQEVGEVIDCGDGIARIKGLPDGRIARIAVTKDAEPEAEIFIDLRLVHQVKIHIEVRLIRIFKLHLYTRVLCDHALRGER